MRDEINVGYEVIVRLILPWPGSRYQPGILEMSPPHPLLGILRTSPHALLHPYFSRSEIGETSEKGYRKEIEKQRCLKHARANVNIPNVASTGPSQGKTETPQKNSDCLGNLRVDETNMDGAPEATLKRIPCIRKVNAEHPIFAKELGLQVRPIA